MSQIGQSIILVVDPCGLDLTATAALLHERGFDVQCAQDRRAALKAISQLSVDLIIYDSSIDHESEICLMDQIREVPRCKDVPVMFSSANQIPNVIRRTDRFGSCYHLRKPYEAKVLLTLVDKIFGPAHLLQRPQFHPHFGSTSSTNLGFGQTVS